MPDTTLLPAFLGFSSESLYSTLAIIGVLGGLIFFHELGHFLVAKAFKVGVKTFSLGFGPKLFGFRYGDTEYQVAAFPLGGYVSMVGESDPADIPEPFSQKDSFSLRAPWQRLLIIVAGPLFNLFLAWALYWGLFWTHGQEYLLPVVGVVSQGSAAEAAGIQSGDAIVSIDGKAVYRWDDLLTAVMASEGRPLTLSVMNTARGNSIVHITATPKPFERKSVFGETKTSWAIGVSPSGKTAAKSFGFLESAGEGSRHAVFVTKLIGESVVKMFERVVPLESMGGPIRIAKEIHRQAAAGSMAGVLMLAAFISLNLGLLNLLPIPVLDGGHILFLLFEMVFRRPVPEVLQDYSARIGVALLLGLMLFVTYNDISKWFQGEL